MRLQVQYSVAGRNRWANQWEHETEDEAFECATNLFLAGYDARVLRSGRVIWPTTTEGHEDR